jgi:hypothetical protein
MLKRYDCVLPCLKLVVTLRSAHRPTGQHVPIISIGYQTVGRAHRGALSVVSEGGELFVSKTHLFCMKYGFKVKYIFCRHFALLK